MLIGVFVGVSVGVCACVESVWDMRLMFCVAVCCVVLRV